MVDLREYDSGREPVTTNLSDRSELEIWRKTVEEYESLAPIFHIKRDTTVDPC